MTFYVFAILSCKQRTTPFLVTTASLQRRVLTYYHTFADDRKTKTKKNTMEKHTHIYIVRNNGSLFLHIHKISIAVYEWELEFVSSVYFAIHFLCSLSIIIQSLTTHINHFAYNTCICFAQYCIYVYVSYSRIDTSFVSV